MKLLHCIFFLGLFFNYSNSQTVSGKIVDSITNKPLDLASITFEGSDYSIFTDSEGKFNVNPVNKNDRLRISYIGYETKIVDLSNFNEDKEYNQIFYLNPKSNSLTEIVIPVTKINYNPDKTLKTIRENTQYCGFQFGTENCTFIANTFKKKGKVKTVIIDLKKISEFNNDNPEWKRDYLATYNIKFYSFDSRNNKPGEEIYNRDIVVEPENRTYKLKVNVDSLNIPFPENGICVGVEIINTKYTNPKKVFAIIGPIINFTENRMFYPIMSWVRYRNDDWKFKTALSQDKKGRKYNMMIVDLTVKIEK